MSPRLRRALRDERGAIMVLGLFMAVFASGCLLYVIGLGETIAQRERMQDGADAAALSAAILHARGMNLIALMNMIMAALLAVLIVLKLVQAIAIVGIGIAVALAYPTAGQSLNAVAPLGRLAVKAQQGHDKLKKGIHPAIKAMRVAARGVRVAVPWMAQARSIQTVMTHYDPPVAFGFVVPDRLTLPTRDGTFDDLCNKAGDYVGDLVSYPLSVIPVAGDIVAPIADEATDSLILNGSGFFCGSNDDSSEPPVLEYKRETRLPLLPGSKDCQDNAQSGVEAADEAKATRLCEEAAAETKRSESSIDPRTGEHTGDRDAWEERIVLAIAACAPRADDSALDQFDWQEHRFTQRYKMVGGSWRVDGALIDESFVRVQTDERPCGTEDAEVGPAWNATRRNDFDEVVPVCEAGGPPEDLGHEGEIVEVEHVQVLHVFGCRETVIERRELSEGAGELAPANDGDAKAMAPQLLEEGVMLGERDFQLRSAVIGALPETTPKPVLRLLKSAEHSNNVPWLVARRLGHVAFAQAEYFYAVPSPDAPPDLWSMRWQARLRRFRLPEAREQTRDEENESIASSFDIGEVTGSLEKACQIAAAAADSDIGCDLLDLSIADLVVH